MKAFRLVIFTLFICVLSVQVIYGSVGVNVGQEAPDFSLKNLEGDTVHLKDFRGEKIVILDFWASWCGPCRRAIPELNKIQNDYEKKDVRVLGVNVGESPSKVVAFKKQNMVKYPTLLDVKSTVAREYRVTGIPNLIMVDKDGIVQYNGHSPYELKNALGKLVK